MPTSDPTDPIKGDDMSDINCPRAKTRMTPCVARDGALAVSDPPNAVCVGCGWDPRDLRRDLGLRYEPARPRGKPAADRCAEADRFRDDVAAVESGELCIHCHAIREAPHAE